MSTTGMSFRGLVGDARVKPGAKPTLVFRSRRDRNRNNQLMRRHHGERPGLWRGGLLDHPMPG